ncbi:hypothetical protein PMIN06_002377 [Paraphaeosphaeria minitans]
MLFKIAALFALLALIVVATPIAEAGADADANLAPTPSINDGKPIHTIPYFSTFSIPPSPPGKYKLADSGLGPSVVARAPLKVFTQDLDVNDPGPGGHQVKGGPKEKSWIDNMATAKADCALM